MFEVFLWAKGHSNMPQRQFKTNHAANYEKSGKNILQAKCFAKYSNPYLAKIGNGF